MATLNFSTDGVEPLQRLDTIPRGRYEAMIVSSEQKATKAGTGSYLQLDFQIISGEQHGRHVWSRLNLENPNETAVRIAQQELAAICMALGLTAVAESEELHDKPLLIDVIVEKTKDGNDANRVKAYLSQAGVAPVRTTPATPKPASPPPAAKPAGAKAPPWSKAA